MTESRTEDWRNPHRGTRVGARSPTSNLQSQSSTIQFPTCNLNPKIFNLLEDGEWRFEYGIPRFVIWQTFCEILSVLEVPHDHRWNDTPLLSVQHSYPMALLIDIATAS